MGFNIDMQAVRNGCAKGYGIMIEQGGKLWEKSGVILREGGVLLEKAFSVLKAGGDKATPYLQGNVYLSGAAFFVASFVIFRFSVGLANRAQKIIPEQREKTRIAVHNSVCLLSIGCLFWKTLQYADRAQLPLTWFPMVMLGLCALGMQGDFFEASAKENNGIPHR